MLGKNEDYWSTQKIVLTCGHQQSRSMVNGSDYSSASSINESDDEMPVKRHRGGGNVTDCPPKLLWHVRNRPDYFPLALTRPYDVDFMENGFLVVADGFWPRSRIQIFNEGGLCMRTIAQGQTLPFSVAVQKLGDIEAIAITDHHERTVKMYDSKGKMLCSWGKDCFEWPNGIATMRGGSYVVTDWSRGCISIHQSDGMRLHEFRSHDNESQHTYPQYVATDFRNRILITDSYDHSVKVFDADGHFLFKFGHDGGDGQIADPKDLTVDHAGNIVVADRGKHCLSLYSPDGQYIQPLLMESDGIRHPWGLASNRNGLLVLSELEIKMEPSLKMFSTS